MENKNTEKLTIQQIQGKLEYYCAYQERCYKEVEEKLYSFKISTLEKEQILIYLIENNFITKNALHKVLFEANTIINLGEKIELLTN